MLDHVQTTQLGLSVYVFNLPHAAAAERHFVITATICQERMLEENISAPVMLQLQHHWSVFILN